MENGMTEMTAKMYNKAISAQLTVDEAVLMLRQCADFRTLSQKLQAYSKGRDIKKLLIEGLHNNHPDANPEAISRKVRNWLNDCQNTLHKEDAIELCFIFGLNLEESDAFVAMISEDALHWRDIDEIPYIFALLKGRTYQQATQLHKQIKDNISEKSNDVSSEEVFTSTIKDEIKKIQTEGDLIDYVIKTKNKLSRFHNTAYQSFCDMMEKLENPSTELANIDKFYSENENYSVGKIVQIYLHRKDIPELKENTKKNLYSALQRSVLQNWPSETVLSRIKKRHTDVSRKVLILLFLATYDCYAPDESENNYEWKEDDIFLETEFEKTRDEIFTEFYTNMNIMLEGCGFKILDPRSPFDWMIIFCMCADDMYDIDGTLSAFLQNLFIGE